MNQESSVSHSPWTKTASRPVTERASVSTGTSGWAAREAEALSTRANISIDSGLPSSASRSPYIPLSTPTSSRARSPASCPAAISAASSPPIRAATSPTAPVSPYTSELMPSCRVRTGMVARRIGSPARPTAQNTRSAIALCVSRTTPTAPLKP